MGKKHLSDILPQIDSTHNIGATDNRWANIYADTLYGDGSNLINIAADVAKTLQVTVKNVSGGQLTKGTVVHVSPSASPPSGNVVEVIAADYDDAAKMPAIGILKETIANEAEGEAVMSGALSGIATDGFTAGDELYVGADGALTNTKPQTAGQLIQKIAVCVKSHASNGLIKIFGAGRSNDVPLPLYIDNTNQRVGIGTASPGEKLEVNGNILVDKGTSNRTAYVSDDGIYISRNTDGNYVNSVVANSSNSNYLDVKARSRVNLVLNNSDVLTAVDTGNVGIGTTSPFSDLSINVGANAPSSSGNMASEGLTVHNAAGGRAVQIGVNESGAYNYIQSSYVNNSNVAVNLAFFTGASERMRIDSTGNVGIGTESPGAKLDVVGDIRVNDPLGYSFTTSQNTVITPDYIHASATPFNIAWHDLLAFKRNYTVTQETSTDNITFSSATVTDGLFAQKDKVKYDVITSGVRSVRWNFTGVAYNVARYFYIAAGYSSPTPSCSITIETSSDGTNWTVIHQSTGVTFSANNRFYHVDPYIGNGGDNYCRLTIDKGNTDTKVVSLTSLKMLTQRLGDQGKGREDELPFLWDNNKKITLEGGATTNSTSTVISSRKFTAIDSGGTGLYADDASSGLSIADNGNATFSSNVGIGVTSPSNKLEVVGGASDDVIARFQATGSGTSDFSEIHIANDANSRLILGSIGSNYSNTAWAGMRYVYATTGDLGLKAIGSGGKVRIYAGSSTNEVMRITDSSNVGIGTANPETKLHVDTGIDDGTNTVLISHTRNNSDVETQALKIDMDLSGADTTSGDRVNSGIFIDIDSSADGDASNEQRIYGIYTDVRHTGFSDIVRGGYFRAENNNSTEKVSQLVGAYGQAEHDSNSANGGVSSMMGVFGISNIQDTGDVDNAYGGYFNTIISTNRVANVDNTYGVRAEIQIDKDTPITFGNMIGVASVIDNNEDSTPVGSNTYLFKGDYQGTRFATNAWGIYVAGDKHYLGGDVGIGTDSPNAKLEVSTDSPTNNVAALIGDGWVANDSYHKQGGLLLISGTSQNATQTGAGIAFQTRNTANTNYWKSSIIMDRDGAIRFTLGGAGTGAGSEDLTILSNGNVGIGTTSPSYKLDVGGGNFFVNGSNRDWGGTGGLGTHIGTGDFDIYSGTPGSGTHRLKVTNGGSVGIGTTSPGAKLDVEGDVQIKSANISNQENTDVDSAAAEMVAQVAIATYTAAFFDFVIKKGTNVRSGTVYACHDGTNVEFTETSTQDLGDTSDVVLSVDISSGNMRLIATVTSDDWSVKTLVKAI